MYLCRLKNVWHSYDCAITNNLKTTKMNQNPFSTIAPKRLLFVCLGNICRSPAAEGVMKAKVSSAGIADSFFIDSAGIGDWHVGQLPDRRMRERAALRGYRLDSRARQLRQSDFADFDLILVMDADNYRIVSSKAPDEASRSKVRMLADYLTTHRGTPAIPDPYYGTSADFDYALDLIEDATAGLLAALMRA